jgi:peptidyl-prolyl cis-trans isomerase SurA
MGTWKAGPLKDLSTPLLKIGAHEVVSGEFAAYMEKEQYHGKAREPRAWVDQLYKSFSDEQVIAYEESRLPEKYPEFRYIYDEYHDGILLFDIMDQQVWSRAIADTSGLEAFHKANRRSYMWGERMDAYLLSCSEGANVNAIRKAHKKIRKGKLDQDALNDMYCNSDTVPCVSLTHHLFEKGEHELIDASWGISGLGPVQEQEGTSSFVIVKEIRPPEPKKLDETRGQVTSDYQEYLEARWLESLKEKYPVRVNTELLKQIKP